MADRKSNKTSPQKELILDKAGSLFWEKGYDRTTMKDIAKACGFEAGNIYNYFHSKEQILYEVIKEEVSTTLASVSHLETDNDTIPTEQIKLIVKTYFHYISGQHRANRLIFDTELRNLSTAHLKEIIGIRDHLDSIVSKIIRKGIDAGEFAEIDEKIACFAISSMIIRSRIWFSPGGRLSPDEIANIMSQIALNGLRGSKKESDGCETLRKV